MRGCKLWPCLPAFLRKVRESVAEVSTIPAATWRDSGGGGQLSEDGAEAVSLLKQILAARTQFAPWWPTISRFAIQLRAIPPV